MGCSAASRSRSPAGSEEVKATIRTARPAAAAARAAGAARRRPGSARGRRPPGRWRCATAPAVGPGSARAPAASGPAARPAPAARPGAGRPGGDQDRPLRCRRPGTAASSSSSGRTASRPAGSIRRSTGPVMKVVTRATSTRAVNSAGVTTPSSRPMLSTISSVRPRVFISAAIALDSRGEKPVRRAATRAPTHLPAIATASSTTVSSHSSGRSSRPTWTRRPVTTKNSGSSTVTTKSSTRLVTSRVRSARRGMIRPMTKAPKMAAIPMRWEANADSSTPTKIAAIQPPGTCPASS